MLHGQTMLTVDTVVHNKAANVQNPLSLCVVTALVIIGETHCAFLVTQDCSRIAYISGIEYPL